MIPATLHAVRPRSLWLRLAGLLCLLALLAAQGFGPGRLFVCECGEVPVLTHAAACEPAGPSDDSDSHRDGDHQHFAATGDMSAASFGKISVPAVAMLPLVPWFLVERAPALELASKFSRDYRKVEPPPPLAVTQSSVILV